MNGDFSQKHNNAITSRSFSCTLFVVMVYSIVTEVHYEACLLDYLAKKYYKISLNKLYFGFNN